MTKSVLLVSVLVVFGQAQRPPYAGTANRYPQVLDRFKDNLTTTSTTTLAPSTSTSTSTIVDRLGEGSSTAMPTSSSPAPTSTSASPDGILYPSEELPVLSLGDAELVDRIKTWPREKQPWWYVNRVAIQEQLHPVGQPIAAQSAPATKPFFSG